MQLRLAVVGTSGYSYAILAQAWAMPDRFKVVAVCAMDRADPRSTECAARGAIVHSDYQSLLQGVKGSCDLVYNPTPIYLHRPFAEECLAAGLDMVIEKPPVATIQDHVALIESARRAGRRIGVGFNHLYARRLRELKSQLLEGRYGRLKKISGIGAWMREDAYYARNDWAGRARLGKDWVLDGSLTNPLAHLLCNQLFLAGATVDALAEPESVEAELYRAHRIETEDVASARVVTRAGLELLAHTTLCAEKVGTPTTVLHCELATITVEDFVRVTVRYADGSVEERPAEKDSKEEMFESLYRAWRNRTTFPVSLETTLPFTKTVNLAWESSDGGRAIPSDCIVELPSAGSRRIKVNGLDSAMEQAHEHGVLLHEVGPRWTTPPRRLYAGDYDYFPSRSQVLRSRFGADADGAPYARPPGGS